MQSVASPTEPEASIIKMHKRTRSALSLFCTFICCLDYCVALAGENQRIGDVPPALALNRMLQGPAMGGVSWDKLKGKVVVLEFWETSCGPCLAAIPHLNELVDEFRQKPVVFLSVTGENEEHVKAFLKRKPAKGWIAIDDFYDVTRTAFGVNAIPTTFIVDASGKIAAITHPARLTAEHLNEVLAGKPCTLPPPEPDSATGDLSVVPVPVHRIFEVSIKGPFPQPKGAFGFRSWDETSGGFEAKKAYLRDALAEFFQIDPKLIIEKTNLPDGLYDISVTGPRGKTAELKAQFTQSLKTAFGITVQTNRLQMEVYAMTIASTNAPELRRVQKRGGGGGQVGGFLLRGTTMDSIATFLEMALNVPVVNETQSTNLWGAGLEWELSESERLLSRLDRRILSLIETNPTSIISGELPKDLQDAIVGRDLELLKLELARPKEQQFRPDREKVIKAAREQLGLELRPANRNVTVLEIRDAQ
jgi:uncharacterized protein (TIGR03435 family)